MQAIRTRNRPTPKPVVESVATAHYRIPVASVRLGMFVAELDRPWLDTRFGVQGFLVSSPKQIEVLREQCQTVTIDADRSDTEMADAVSHIGTPVTRPPGSGRSGDALCGKAAAPAAASTQVASAAPAPEQGSGDKAGVLKWFRSTLGLTKRAEEPSKASSMPRELQAEL